MIPRPLRRLSRALLAPFLDPQPASRLIRLTARQQWKLLAVNLTTNLVEAFGEGATFGVIFLAVEMLSSPTAVSWASHPLVGHVPALGDLMAALPRTTLFLSLLGLALLLQAAQSLARYGNAVSLGYFAARCRALMTARIHSQILSFSYPFASHYRVGDLTDHAGQGPEAIRLQIEATGRLLVTVLLIGVYLFILAGLSPWLLVVALGLAVLILQIQRRILPRIMDRSVQVSGIEVEISTLITEDIQGLRLLHSSGQLDAADQALRGRMGQLEQALRSRSRLMEVIGPITSFLPVAAMALMAALSLLFFGNRSTGVLPSLVTFVLALQRLNMRFAGVAGITNQLAENGGRLRRLNGILGGDGKQFRRLGGCAFEGLKQEIRFETVGLQYAPDLPPVLSGIELTLPKGQTLALVGPSGAGKSSIADLLVGLYCPSEGRILIDGLDLAGLDLASWQQRLGVVSQDTFLFNDTLAANIAFGCPWATRADIEAAAVEAQVSGFIGALPLGYDTLVGERGYRLSGGQRQRISLARAILRHPELLILDEATSALDSQTEQLVQQAIERFEQQCTVLVIAHRLSTIVKADQICVLDHGRIVERGRHCELFAIEGLYHRQWTQQASHVLTVG
ncbi:ABC transporter ATP-binding protein [Synechococcus sp. RedBA-s]|uniref:ABC transporter ATP-binding protein n=1 Tax=Synechococcus sp. RedBA-s TaxID=2823741 RepID=UPI0020CD793D|nr:ABC transporter ATP-binding protein [Synechococcus sp. RedBA-s]MCP9801390.1 ABC transporter ATP-binding protein [Synechococcus sp. RedBA-s]